MILAYPHVCPLWFLVISCAFQERGISPFMLGPLDGTYLNVEVRADIPFMECPQSIITSNRLESYLFPNLVSQFLVLICHLSRALWTSPQEE